MILYPISDSDNRASINCNVLISVSLDLGLGRVWTWYTRQEINKVTFKESDAESGIIRSFKISTQIVSKLPGVDQLYNYH